MSTSKNQYSPAKLVITHPNSEVETRRLQIPISGTAENSYNYLCDFLQTIYHGKVDPYSLKITYKDQDGDICIISSQPELVEAFNCSSIPLKLYVSLDGPPSISIPPSPPSPSLSPSPSPSAPMSHPYVPTCPPRQPTPRSLHPNVLLVEDVRVSQKIATLALQRAHYRVIPVSDGETAVKEYEKHIHDIRIILMDLSLPGISGVEACEYIRHIENEHREKNKDFPPVYIFCLTGNANEENLKLFKAAGMNGCILKGFLLVESIQLALDALQNDPNTFFVRNHSPSVADRAAEALASTDDDLSVDVTLDPSSSSLSSSSSSSPSFVETKPSPTSSVSSSSSLFSTVSGEDASDYVRVGSEDEEEEEEEERIQEPTLTKSLPDDGRDYEKAAFGTESPEEDEEEEEAAGPRPLPEEPTLATLPESKEQQNMQPQSNPENVPWKYDEYGHFPYWPMHNAPWKYDEYGHFPYWPMPNDHSSASTSNPTSNGPFEHRQVICDGDCATEFIVGPRFKCTACPNFDLCEKCEEHGGDFHDRSHVMLKIKAPMDNEAARELVASVCEMSRSSPRCPRRWLRGLLNPHCASLPNMFPSFRPCAALIDSASQAFPLVQPGSTVHREYKLHNTGARKWPKGTRLVFVGAESVNEKGVDESALSFPVPECTPGEVFKVSIDIIAPQEEGPCRSHFRLQTADGYRFGPVIPIQLIVAKINPDSQQMSEQEQQQSRDHDEESKEAETREEDEEAEESVTSPSSPFRDLLSTAESSSSPVSCETIVEEPLKTVEINDDFSESPLSSILPQAELEQEAVVKVLSDAEESVNSSAAPEPEPEPEAEAENNSPYVFADELKLLKEMGFSVDDDAIKAALDRYHGDVQRALNSLLC